MTTYELPNRFRDVILNLILDSKDPQKANGLAASGESVLILRDGLSRVLVDPDAMRAYLSYLQDMGVKHPFPPDEPLSWERQSEVIAHGLGDLNPRELAVLAINPLNLLDLRDRLAEEDEVSDAWWPTFRRYNPLAATVADAFEEHALELNELLSERSEESIQRELAGAFFGEVPADQGISATRNQPVHWSRRVRLAEAIVEWAEKNDPDFCRRLPDAEWNIEFDLHVEGDVIQFEARPGSPLVLSSKVDCQAELRDGAGQKLVHGTRDELKIIFQTDSPTIATVDHLWIEYHHPARCKLALKVNLRNTTDAVN